MARIGLIDYKGKQVNLALMKLSSYHKSIGNTVVLNPKSAGEVDHVYCSVIFSWHKNEALQLAKVFPSIEYGGTGIDLVTNLSAEVEAMLPDYDLYDVATIENRIKGIMTKETRRQKAEVIVNAGIGRITTGCTRSCSFCCVPRKEGKLKRVANISDLLNPRSNVLTLLDNNLTADPDAIPILNEMRDRKLIVDITQGIDIRTMTPAIAKALSEVKLLRTAHFSWDQIHSEKSVTAGINLLSNFVARSKQLCYVLCGYDTSWQEDLHRFHKLIEMKIDPYIMCYCGDGGEADPYNQLRLKHFARWVNGRIYKACKFSEYTNWLKAQDKFFSEQEQPMLLAA